MKLFDKYTYDEHTVSRRFHAMPHANTKYPPNQIRKYRRQRGLRLRDVAVLTGVRWASHLSHWEKGRKLPNLPNAFKLASAIQCPVEILFRDLHNQIRHEVFRRRQEAGIKLRYE